MGQAQKNIDVLIVGAGLSGLIAARVMQKQGLRPLILEQSPRVGGRLATLKLGPGLADIGAQFFTVRSRKFQSWIEQWIIAGLAFRWSTGWSKGSLTRINFDSYPRYAIREGMEALAQYLARGLEVRLNAGLSTITPDGAGWRGHTVDGQRFSARALLLTPPIPQSLDILDKSDIQLSQEERAVLETITYAPCLTGIFRLDGAIHLPEPGAIQHPYAPITWIADNRHKGISPEAPLVTVQAGESFSREYWDTPETAVLTRLSLSFKPYLTRSTQILQARLKRWRFARPTSFHGEHFLAAANLPPLLFAGDAFESARIEGAVLSGEAAGKFLASQL